jgi:hypothetical protein
MMSWDAALISADPVPNSTAADAASSRQRARPRALRPVAASTRAPAATA